MARKRALLVFIRKDIVREWGWPEVALTSKLGRVELADVLAPAAEAAHLFLCKDEFPVVWNDRALNAETGKYGDAANVAGYVHGKDVWGHRVYRFALPATKASSFGFSGRTHLVAQRW
jgi:hypothetical protein